MADVKETICTHCEHSWVCKYRDELISTVKSIDEIMTKSRFSYVITCPDYTIKPACGVRGERFNVCEETKR